MAEQDQTKKSITVKTVVKTVIINLLLILTDAVLLYGGVFVIGVIAEAVTSDGWGVLGVSLMLLPFWGIFCACLRGVLNRLWVPQTWIATEVYFLEVLIFWTEASPYADPWYAPTLAMIATAHAIGASLVVWAIQRAKRKKRASSAFAWND